AQRRPAGDLAAGRDLPHAPGHEGGDRGLHPPAAVQAPADGAEPRRLSGPRGRFSVLPDARRQFGGRSLTWPPIASSITPTTSWWWGPAAPACARPSAAPRRGSRPPASPR